MNIDAMERDLKAVQDAAATLYAEQAKTAETEQRERSDEEKAELEAHLAKGRQLKARIEKAKGAAAQLTEIHRLSADMTPVGKPEPTPAATSIPSLGQQFVASSAYDFIKAGGHRSGSAWRSPGAELFATTLDESSGSGGPLIVTDYRPGIVPLLFKRLVVADLIASGTTDSNSVTYMKETTFTNAAAPVAEGGVKPESTLVFVQVTDSVRKLAHWLPVTEEMLEDASQIRSYIDARLRLGVELTEEDQLLNGSGTAPAIQGIMNRAGLATAVARGTDTNADAVFKQIMAIFTNSFIQPDGVVMNPANWQTIQLTKDANGQYYGSGPFAGPQTRTLWGLPVVVTPSIVANTALVGAYRQAAQVFRKGGLRVEASNSHSDYFIKNLVAIRAEERLALAVYRPAGFGQVTGAQLMPRYSSTLNQMVRGDAVTTYTANGAIAINDGVHAIAKTSAAAMTLAAPGAGDEGTRITVVARTAFAHTLTVTGGIGGRGVATDVVTFAAVGDAISLIADNLVWIPMGAPFGATIA